MKPFCLVVVCHKQLRVPGVKTRGGCRDAVLLSHILSSGSTYSIIPKGSSSSSSPGLPVFVLNANIRTMKTKLLFDRDPAMKIKRQLPTTKTKRLRQDVVN